MIHSPLLPQDLPVKSEFLIIFGYETYQLLVNSVPWMPRVWLFLVGGRSHSGTWCQDGSNNDKK